MMFNDEAEFSASMGVGETYTCSNQVTAMRKKKDLNRRRFSDEQIRSLELMFESETRLEPRKKLQVAKELGLQPRQVAIWFQNRRARWKSKQLERDYSILRANYNSLASRFENLKKEKQALAIQLQKLNDLMQTVHEEGISVDSTDEKSENGDTIKGEPERCENEVGVVSNEESRIKGIEEAQMQAMVEPRDGSMTSPENWSSLDSDTLFEQSDTNYQWWDFWS